MPLIEKAGAGPEAETAWRGLRCAPAQRQRVLCPPAAKKGFSASTGAPSSPDTPSQGDWGCIPERTSIWGEKRLKLPGQPSPWLARPVTILSTRPAPAGSGLEQPDSSSRPTEHPALVLGWCHPWGLVGLHRGCPLLIREAH